MRNRDDIAKTLSGNTDGPSHWAGPPEGVLIQVPMDMVTVIYDRRSAQTHVVASPVPEILAALGVDCISENTIWARLAHCFDMQTADDSATILHERLRDMAALGLIARMA